MTDSALVAQPTAPQPVDELQGNGRLTESQILDRLQTVAAVLAPDAHLTAPELQLFAMVAARNGLDPFAKQLYAIRRQGKLTFQTGIDGYRSTAARTGEYDGSDLPEFGPMVDKPWPHPEWAQVSVYRKGPDGVRRKQEARGWWDEYVPGPPNDFRWKQAPRAQLAKCVEALALRMAFPYVLADVFVDAEMDRLDSDDAADAEARRIAALPTAGDRLAARRAALEAAATTVEGESKELPPSRPADPATGEMLETRGAAEPELTWPEFRQRMVARKLTAGAVKTAAEPLFGERVSMQAPDRWELEPVEWARLAAALGI